jgi:hypothetical protein
MTTEPVPAGPTPLYFQDTSIPPIYGYLPYAKYTKKNEWVVRTPCQPSIIPMAGPDGVIFLTYEHPIGSNIKGKNTKTTLVHSLTGSTKALFGAASLLGNVINEKVCRIFVK